MRELTADEARGRHARVLRLRRPLRRSALRPPSAVDVTDDPLRRRQRGSSTSTLGPDRRASSRSPGALWARAISGCPEGCSSASSTSRRRTTIRWDAPKRPGTPARRRAALASSARRGRAGTLPLRRPGRPAGSHRARRRRTTAGTTPSRCPSFSTWALVWIPRTGAAMIRHRPERPRAPLPGRARPARPGRPSTRRAARAARDDPVGVPRHPARTRTGSENGASFAATHARCRRPRGGHRLRRPRSACRGGTPLRRGRPVSVSSAVASRGLSTRPRLRLVRRSATALRTTVPVPAGSRSTPATGEATAVSCTSSPMMRTSRSRSLPGTVEWLVDGAHAYRLPFRAAPRARASGSSASASASTASTSAATSSTLPSSTSTRARAHAPTCRCRSRSSSGGASFGFHLDTGRRVRFDVGAADPDQILVEVDLEPGSVESAADPASLRRQRPQRCSTAFLAASGRPDAAAVHGSTGSG